MTYMYIHVQYTLSPATCTCSYCALQVSCLGKVREWHPSLSLYKLEAFVTCSINVTELSTWEPPPIYLLDPFHWTTDLPNTGRYTKPKTLQLLTRTHIVYTHTYAVTHHKDLVCTRYCMALIRSSPLVWLALLALFSSKEGKTMHTLTHTGIHRSFCVNTGQYAESVQYVYHKWYIMKMAIALYYY